MYDALYKMNIGCDFVDPSTNDIEKYKLLIVPALYAAPDSLLERLNRFVKMAVISFILSKRASPMKM